MSLIVQPLRAEFTNRRAGLRSINELTAESGDGDRSQELFCVLSPNKPSLLAVTAIGISIVRSVSPAFARLVA